MEQNVHLGSLELQVFSYCHLFESSVKVNYIMQHLSNMFKYQKMTKQQFQQNTIFPPKTKSYNDIFLYVH